MIVTSVFGSSLTVSNSGPSSSPHDADPDNMVADSLRPFVGGDPVVVVDGTAPRDASNGEGFVHAPFVLQDVADYREALQSWFAMLRVGGRLAIEVPNALLCERTLALPSRRHPARRRLYTPASLLAEVEEALEPNSFRVRLLRDRDEGYDYTIDRDAPPVGEHAILLVIERIEIPSWTPDTGEVAGGAAPDFAFEPEWTRREIVALRSRRRILILKLDHLGDFIMGLPALERARQVFADAEITLVVGSWNQAMASAIGVADTIVAFDAFPRNSTEEAVDLSVRVAAFREAIVGAYDLAIDLRTDPDTRFFLRHVEANIRAGLGTRAQFDFLDIFLPIDITRHGFEAAHDQSIDHHAYSAVPECRRTPFSITYDPRDRVAKSPYIVWGPYVALQVGEYLYEPLIEVSGDGTDLVLVDVAIDLKQVASALVSPSSVPRLRFFIEDSSQRVEFRIVQPRVDAHVGFSFHGGRLLRRGSSSVLHQSEYLALLVELIEMRTAHHGVLQADVATP